MIHQQIEDMAKSIEEALKHNISCNMAGTIFGYNTRGMARELIDDGYRKTTGCVVKTIAEEILEMAECYGAGVLFWKKMKKFAIDLKKNCTEGCDER